MTLSPFEQALAKLPPHQQQMALTERAAYLLHRGPGIPDDDPERVKAEAALGDLYRRVWQRNPATGALNSDERRLERRYKTICAEHPSVNLVAYAQSLGLLPTKESDHANPDRAEGEAAHRGT